MNNLELGQRLALPYESNWTLTTNGVVRRTCDLHDDPHQSMIPIDRIRYG